MIVKIYAFSVSLNFLESALPRELPITSFMHRSVAVVTWKSKIPFLTKFKIMKLKIDAFRILMIFSQALYQGIYESILS